MLFFYSSSDSILLSFARPLLFRFLFFHVLLTSIIQDLVLSPPAVRRLPPPPTPARFPPNFRRLPPFPPYPPTAAVSARFIRCHQSSITSHSYYAPHKRRICWVTKAAKKTTMHRHHHLLVLVWSRSIR